MGSANGHGIKAETCLIMMGERGHPTPGRAKERRRTPNHESQRRSRKCRDTNSSSSHQQGLTIRNVMNSPRIHWLINSLTNWINMKEMICFCAPRGLRFLPAATFAHEGEAADLQSDRSVLYLYHQVLKWDLAGGRTPASSVAVQHETKKSHYQSHDQPAQQAVVS